MTEYPHRITLVEDQPSYGWSDVARDMGEWHPDLQPHAARLLEVHGVPTVGTDAPGPPAAQHFPEKAEPESTVQAQIESGKERPFVPAEKISEAFADSQRTIYKLSADAHFHAACMERGIDPYDDMDKPGYWNAVAAYTQTRIHAMREKGMGDELKLKSLELLSATPAFLFEQQALNQKTHSTHAERRQAKENVSYYNGLIRDFATEFPETRVTDLSASLLGITNIAIEHKGMRQAAARSVSEVIRGAQHEKGFGQILEATGHPFRSANVQEDLGGVDYVVDEHTGRPMYIDVKASLSEIEARGASGAFVLKPNDKVVMYSLIKDSELNNTFYLDDATAQLKAGVLNQLLAQVRQQNLSA